MGADLLSRAEWVSDGFVVLGYERTLTIMKEQVECQKTGMEKLLFYGKIGRKECKNAAKSNEKLQNCANFDTTRGARKEE